MGGVDGGARCEGIAFSSISIGNWKAPFLKQKGNRETLKRGASEATLKSGLDHGGDLKINPHVRNTT